MNKFLSIINLGRLIECRSITTKTRINADGKDVPKRKDFENRVTLIGIDNSVSITNLKNAQSLSERRELKLVKIQDVDSKTRRPIYKLMTNAEYHAEELVRRQEKQAARQSNSSKGEKLLTLSTKIGEHDLMTGVRKMLKLLEKQYEVRVVVSGESEDAAAKSDHIYSIIEKNIKQSGKIVQKRVKGNSLRFQLLPNRNNATDQQNSNGDEKIQGPL